MVHEQQTIGWDGKCFVSDCIPPGQIWKTKEVKVLSLASSHSLGASLSITCFRALVESARFHETKLYQFWCWLSQYDDILRKLGIQERITHIKAGKDMLGVSLYC